MRTPLSGETGRHELVLMAFLAAELLLFSFTGRRFATAENGFEILRVSVEFGLLALVMTPVILTGGIDLSAGSLLGLCAIVLGKLWRDAGLDPGWASALALAAGAAGGLLNGVLIARLKLPPLIVTLGSFSLFRGLAEAITQGVDNFTGFPDSFLLLGQGYILGAIPAQVPIFLAVAAGLWLLVHRTPFGRSLRALGYSPEGARFAGLPVGRNLILVYVLSGAGAGLAAIIYVAHLGQAKADAGTGYELLAITAVVLGGASIFGGKGSVHGTLLGLAALAVLKNGIALSDRPSEWVGMATGALLLAVLSGEAMLKKMSARVPRSPTRDSTSMPSGSP